MSLQDAPDPVDADLDKAQRTKRRWTPVFIAVFLVGGVASFFWIVLAAAYPEEFTWSPTWTEESACETWQVGIDALESHERPCRIRVVGHGGTTVDASSGRARLVHRRVYSEAALEYDRGHLLRVTEDADGGARTHDCRWWKRPYARESRHSGFEPGPPDWNLTVSLEEVRFPRLRVERRKTEDGEIIELDIDDDGKTDRRGTMEFDGKGRITKSTWTEAACPPGLDVWERASCPDDREPQTWETRWVRDDQDRLIEIVSGETVQLELDYCD